MATPAIAGKHYPAVSAIAFKHRKMDDFWVVSTDNHRYCGVIYRSPEGMEYVWYPDLSLEGNVKQSFLVALANKLVELNSPPPEESNQPAAAPVKTSGWIRGEKYVETTEPEVPFDL